MTFSRPRLGPSILGLDDRLDEVEFLTRSVDAFDIRAQPALGS